MTVVVELNEAMNTLPELINRVKHGDEVLLSESATLVARIMPPIQPNRGPRVPGTGIGKFVMHDDFDAALPEERTPSTVS